MWRHVPVFLLVLVLLTPPLRADNRVGDADNSGTLDLADATLVQQYLYSTVLPTAISPLALADGDSDIDLADLMLVGQAVSGNQTVSGPGGWLTFSDPTNGTATSGDAPLNIFWGVFSGYVGVAELTDGLDVTFEMTPGTAESTLSPLSADVASATASTDMTPINTTGAQEFHNPRLRLRIDDSSGAQLTDYARQASFLIDPSVCGNAIHQPGEECDEGVNGDPCDGCNDDCTIASPCGNGVLDCGEVCDDGALNGVNGYCNFDCSNDCMVESTQYYLADINPSSGDFDRIGEDQFGNQYWWNRKEISGSEWPFNNSSSFDRQDGVIYKYSPQMQFQWEYTYAANQLNGPGDEDNVDFLLGDAVVDPSGAVVTSMRSFNTWTFSSGWAPTMCFAIITRINPNGTQDWQQIFPFSLPDHQYFFDHQGDACPYVELDVDGSGAIYLAFNYREPALSGGFSWDGTSVTTTTDDGTFFLSKLDSSGSVLWSRYFTTENREASGDNDPDIAVADIRYSDGKVHLLATSRTFSNEIGIDFGNGLIEPCSSNPRMFALYSSSVGGHINSYCDAASVILHARYYNPLYHYVLTGFDFITYSSATMNLISNLPTSSSMIPSDLLVTPAGDLLSANAGAIAEIQTDGTYSSWQYFGTSGVTAYGDSDFFLHNGTDLAIAWYFSGNWQIGPTTVTNPYLLGRAVMVILGDEGKPNCSECGDGIIDPGETCDDGDASPCAGPCNETCTGNYPATCGDGVVECGEACDPGIDTCCDTDCQSPLPASTECRPVNGLCDVADFCDGVSLTCPTQNVLPVGTSCRAVYGDCDAEDFCDGVDPVCTNTFLGPTVECRPYVSICNPEDYCSGTGSACPDDAPPPPPTVCRPSTGPCDPEELCAEDGITVTCPEDVWEPNGTNCTDDGLFCTGEELCNDGVCRSFPDGVCADNETCHELYNICTVCGDGNQDVPGEQCDDGNTVGDDGCSPTCQNEVCGDGVVQPSLGEVCDDGPDNGNGEGYCVDDCSGVQVCGDGIVLGKENCDDGPDNGSGNGYCSSDCDDVIGCGDGVIEGNEICDDGAANSTAFTPPGDATLLFSNHYYGLFAAAGSSRTRIEAAGNCQIDLGADLLTITSEAENDALTPFISGNSPDNVWLGAMQSPPLSDIWVWDNSEPWVWWKWAPGHPDLNYDCVQLRLNGTWRTDDCDTTTAPYICEFEDGYCNDSCRGYVCGDNLIDGAEACDDGDTIDNGEGGCLSDCSGIQTCGDGVIEGTEVCDDGANNGSGSGFCKLGCQDIEP